MGSSVIKTTSATYEVINKDTVEITIIVIEY